MDFDMAQRAAQLTRRRRDRFDLFDDALLERDGVISRWSRPKPARSG